MGLEPKHFGHILWKCVNLRDPQRGDGEIGVSVPWPFVLMLSLFQHSAGVGGGGER